MKECGKMSLATIIGGIAGGTVALGSAVFAGASIKLFNQVIPRHDSLQVDLSEMADMQKWEEYKKIMVPKKQWLLEQNIEKINIKSRDNLKLQGYYIPAEKESNKIVLMSHGYSSKAMNDFSSLTYFYHKLGFDCFLYDHRAHGESEGDYVGFGILDRFDCLNWIKYIDKRFKGKKQIILHGISMGGATVLMTSGFDELPESVKCIIADCAFTSPHDVFAHILKRDYKLPPFPIMNISSSLCKKYAGYGFKDYSTLTAVKKTKCPILFIHGDEDNFVPTYMSNENYNACNSPKELLIIKNAGHGAGYYENQKQYEDAILKFVNKWITE